MFALLVDPDKVSNNQIETLAKNANDAGVHYVFVGGSLLTDNSFSKCIEVLKKNMGCPIVIFPGSSMQISPFADAILFLSLISGRNADMLIGQHVITAPLLKKTDIEVIPTGYMLIESDKLTSVMYMSNTVPIPREKADIAQCTAMAGELLGLKLIFMDAGSGAAKPIKETMIRKVNQAVSVPLIVGGGINTPEKVINNCKAGADIIVVGNAIEKNNSLIKELVEAVNVKI